MLKHSISLCLPLVFLAFALQAQDNAQPAPTSREVRYKSPLDEDLAKESFEVDYFAKHLARLKDAFDKKEMSNIVANEKVILESMRMETQQMEDKVAGEKVQAELRKNAASGTPSTAKGERPKRDPFADAETVSEKRLETMRYTMGAFERHSFDPANPAQAAKDFVKLDEFLKIMQDELGELKKVRE